MRGRRPSTRYATVRVPFGIRKYLHEFIDIHGNLQLDILFSVQDVDIPFGIRKYLHEFVDIHGYLHLDILFRMWISIREYLFSI